MQRSPAALPCGIPGIGEEIDGAMQQAPQPGRQAGGGEAAEALEAVVIEYSAGRAEVGEGATIIRPVSNRKLSWPRCAPIAISPLPFSPC